MGRTGCKTKDPEYYKAYMRDYYRRNKEQMDSNRKKHFAVKTHQMTPEKAILFGDNSMTASNILKKFSNLVDKLDDELIELLMNDIGAIVEQNRNNKKNE